MKQEIDYVDRVTVYELHEVKTKDDKIFYSRNLIIKSSYGDLLIVLKGKEKSNIELIVHKKEKIKKDGTVKKS